jgi:hypothetical protein
VDGNITTQPKQGSQAMQMYSLMSIVYRLVYFLDLHSGAEKLTILLEKWKGS